MNLRMTLYLLILLAASALQIDAVTLSNSGMPVPIERFINCFGEEVEKRYHLELVSMNDRDSLGGNVIDLLFDYYGDFDVPRARELITQVANAFLGRVAGDASLSKYFCHFPLNLSDVTIKIRHRKGSCGFVYPTLANVDSVLLQDGRIYYETVNASTYTINVLRTESFEDALSIREYRPSFLEAQLAH